MSEALGWLTLPPPFSLPFHREVMFTPVSVKGQTLMHTFDSQWKYLKKQEDLDTHIRLIVSQFYQYSMLERKGVRETDT